MRIGPRPAPTPDGRRDRVRARPLTVLATAAVLGSGFPVLSAAPAAASPHPAGSLTGQVQVVSGASQSRSVIQQRVLKPGRYAVRLSYPKAHARTAVVQIEGRRVTPPRGKALSYTATVTDGALTVVLRAPRGRAVLRGASFTPVTAKAVPVSETAMRGTTRDLRRHPFAATSVWNLPIANAATFEPADSARTRALRDIGTAWANEGTYSHPVVQATASDPLATVTDTNDARRSGTYRIPSTAPVAKGEDRHLHVIAPDGASVDEAWAVQRLPSGSYRVGRHERVDLRGSGIGPSNGTRAYGGSAIGGLIRAWEVDPTHPAYTGRIEHALAIALRSDQLLYTGGRAGYAKGHGTARGYVWPATEQDWDSPWSYSGTVPMGSYVAIPGAVDLEALGLSAQGLMLARAYQDYGAYVTDRSGDPILAYVEPSSAGSDFTRALLGPSWTAKDLNTIRTQLRLVSNNTALTPNGGPLGASRRAGLVQ